jgi:hypothetical protein
MFYSSARHATTKEHDMPEIRTIEITTQEITRNDQLWFTKDLLDSGVSGKGQVNVVVRCVNVANKYVWVNQDNDGPAIRLPKDLNVMVSRSFKTPEDEAAELAKYTLMSMERLVEHAKAYEGNKPILDAFQAGTDVTWSTLDTLVRSTAKMTVTRQFLHALDFTIEKHATEDTEFNLVEFCTGYAEHLTDKLTQTYGFKSTSRSSSQTSNLMEDAEREAQANLLAACKGSVWSY